MSKGKFITFEGGEGSGKSSFLRRLEETLKAEGIPFIMTREPGGTPIAEEIRDVILDKKNVEMDAVTEALLYAASRRQHLVEKVIPNLNNGVNVLSDRFLDSSLAYQGGARGLGFDKVLSINMHATEGLFPDLTILFDLDPEVGLKRISDNDGREVNRLDLEKLSFHQNVRKNFLSLAKTYQNRFVIIDASQDKESVFQAGYKAVKDCING